MINFGMDDVIFPDRKDLKKKLEQDKVLYDDISEQVKKLDTDKIDFSKEDFVPKSDISQKQKVYFWIRIYLKEEVDVEPNTDVTIFWKPSGEKLETKFICYAKRGLEKNLDEQVTNYNPEDDKKVLCLMVDEERINFNNGDIPFLKTLFKLGRYHQRQIWKREDMVVLDSKEVELLWFDIDF
jgi:hypothetical protein